MTVVLAVLSGGSSEAFVGVRSDSDSDSEGLTLKNAYGLWVLSLESTTMGFAALACGQQGSLEQLQVMDVVGPVEVSLNKGSYTLLLTVPPEVADPLLAQCAALVEKTLTDEPDSGR